MMSSGVTWRRDLHDHCLTVIAGKCKGPFTQPYLLHTTFWYVQLFCSYSKTSCMKHRQFSIKICHCCNNVCPGVKRTVPESQSAHHCGFGLWSGQMWDKTLFAGQVRWFFLEYPVFTPPKRLALFEMREMILKGRKPKGWLESFI